MTRGIALTILAIGIVACTTRPPVQAPAREPVAVTTVAAAVRPTPHAFERGGVVRAQTVATLSSRIVAPVVAVHVAPGDRVRAGQVLLTLDAGDLGAAARRADATAAAAEQAVTAARADRAAAGSALTLAGATHGRVAMLAGRRSATAQELDTASADLQNAEARVAAAEARVAEASAAQTAAREAAAAARALSAYTVVRAPFDGVVTEKLIDAGTLASPGTPLVRLEDTRRFRLEVPVDESSAAAVAPGAMAEVILDGRTGPLSQQGRVTEIARSVDAGSHAFVVKIEIAPGAELRSGMFARARFAGPAREALTIPRSAVVSQGQLSTVFVVADKRARMRVVSLGDGTQEIEVLAGLTAGERVIAWPPRTLRDGDPVLDGTPGSSR